MGSHENSYSNPAFSKHPDSSQGKNYPSYPTSGTSSNQTCLGTGLQVTLISLRAGSAVEGPSNSGVSSRCCLLGIPAPHFACPVS